MNDHYLYLLERNCHRKVGRTSSLKSRMCDHFTNMGNKCIVYLYLVKNDKASEKQLLSFLRSKDYREENEILHDDLSDEQVQEIKAYMRELSLSDGYSDAPVITTIGAIRKGEVVDTVKSTEMTDCVRVGDYDHLVVVETKQPTTTSRKWRDIIVDVREKKADLQPRWLQRPYVWDEFMQQRMIRSLLDGTPIPAVIFNLRSRIARCIDGQQRITTAKKFIENEICYYIHEEGKRARQKLWFSEAKGTGSDNIVLGEDAQDVIKCRSIPWIEYNGLTEIEEVDLFLRIQLAMVLDVDHMIHAMHQKYDSIKMLHPLVTKLASHQSVFKVPGYKEHTGYYFVAYALLREIFNKGRVLRNEGDSYRSTLKKVDFRINRDEAIVLDPQFASVVRKTIVYICNKVDEFVDLCKTEHALFTNKSDLVVSLYHFIRGQNEAGIQRAKDYMNKQLSSDITVETINEWESTAKKLHISQYKEYIGKIYRLVTSTPIDAKKVRYNIDVFAGYNSVKEDTREQFHEDLFNWLLDAYSDQNSE